LWFFLYLLTWIDPKTGRFRASYKRISENIGVSIATLKIWLEQLEEEGYVQDESLDGMIVVYVNW